MIKYILSWFQQSSNTQEPKEEKVSDENSITLSIDGFGKPWVSVVLSHTDERSCEKFGKLLYDINSGNYEQAILDVLISLSKDRQSMSQPIQNILTTWANILVRSDATDQQKAANIQKRPFIRPRNVFLGSDK